MKITNYWQNDGSFGDATDAEARQIADIMEGIADRDGHDLAMKEGIGSMWCDGDDQDAGTLIEKWYLEALETFSEPVEGHDDTRAELAEGGAR